MPPAAEKSGSTYDKQSNNDDMEPTSTEEPKTPTSPSTKRKPGRDSDEQAGYEGMLILLRSKTLTPVILEAMSPLCISNRLCPRKDILKGRKGMSGFFPWPYDDWSFVPENSDIAGLSLSVGAF